MNTIIRPYITERSSMLTEGGVYSFLVGKSVTKPQVKEAIKKLYNITPVSVRMINVKGKVRTRGAKKGRTGGKRKALVKVPAGSKIEFV